MKRKSIKFACMTINEANQHLLEQLQQLYDRREAGNIADWVMERLTGSKKIDRIIHRGRLLSADLEHTLYKYIRELAGHRPVQYVLGEAWFRGMKFHVNEQVLIPRPETEELVQWIIDENKNMQGAAIFDVGSGSGCIPIALKKAMPQAGITGCDISTAAITVAEQNARMLNAEISFLSLDILDRQAWQNIPSLNIIVSNPPYIPWKEKTSMGANVVSHEPHQALFVADNDPLVFYRAIAELGIHKLQPKGKIYVEIHEDLGRETAEVFSLAGYQSVEIKKDMQGRERMIRGYKEVSCKDAK